MEDAVLNTHIVTTGAILLLLSGMTAGGAVAQTATDETPGKPLQLLQLLHLASPPDKPATKPQAKVAAKPVARKTAHYAVVRHKQPRVATQVATTARPEPDSVWPAVNSDTPTNVAAVEPAPRPSPAPALADPSELVVAGQTVHIATADEVNEIDLATTDAVTPKAVSPAAMSPPAMSPAMNDVAEPRPKSDSLTAAPQTGEVGSASWIAQVLAAIGGAVTAGSVAWFLIGAAPQRTYG